MHTPTTRTPVTAPGRGTDARRPHWRGPGARTWLGALATLVAGPALAASSVFGTTEAQTCYQYALTGPRVEALSICTAAINSGDLGPRDLAATYTNRGLIQGSRGELALALADHDAALRIDPDNVGVLINRANVLSRMDRHAEALAGYAAAIAAAAATPGGASPKAYFNRALLHKRMGDLRAARADFVRALELSPDNPTYLEALATLR